MKKADTSLLKYLPFGYILLYRSYISVCGKLLCGYRNSVPFVLFAHSCLDIALKEVNSLFNSKAAAVYCKVVKS